jgi:predicted phage terminase large subunit-like protein
MIRAKANTVSLMTGENPFRQALERRLAERRAGGDNDEEALRLEGSFIDFVESAWPNIDSAVFQSNWAITGLAEHLEAVAAGQIKRLLVNFPPRSSKTTVASICFPAWLWAQRQRTFLKGPQVKVLTASYGYNLSMMISNSSRQLILSPWYHGLWGHRISLRADQASKANFANTAGGVRIATSVGGSLLGIGGDIVILDDPHDTAGIESDADREAVLRFWAEISSTRLNHPKESAIVVIKQRLHESDLSGKILSDSAEGEWCHYMVPMEFEAARCCQTGWQTDEGFVTWTDPRALDDDGEPLLTFPDRLPRDDEAAATLEGRENSLMWPERFGPQEVARVKASLGPYMASGRLQQSPQPKGGEIFKADWWQVWDPPDGKFPKLDFIVASVDGAWSEREINDPSAMSVWATFYHPELRAKRVIVLDAWRKHLPLHGTQTQRNFDEIPQAGDTQRDVDYKNARYRQRVSPQWGLVEWIRHTGMRFGADVLLIEKAANGMAVASELQRLYGHDEISVHTIPPKGDKVSRALACQPLFAQHLIFAPKKSWADDLLIKEMSEFPLGKHDHLTDTTSQALNYMRRTGRIMTDEETRAAVADSVRHQPQRGRLYDV